MPTYQYVCTACGEQLEAVQSFSDAALTDCPACQGALRKVFSSVGVVFKGSGFYKTDSRDSAKPAAKGDSPAKSDSKGDSGKGDSGKGDKASTSSSGSSDGGSSSGSGASSTPASTSSTSGSSGSSSTGSSAKSTPAA